MSRTVSRTVSRWLFTLTILASLLASSGCLHRRIACRRAMRMCCPTACAPAGCVSGYTPAAESIDVSAP
jgi:hypothetical protein